MAKTFNLNDYLTPQEQWPMSAADNVFGMSLPEYHPEPDEMDVPTSPAFAATDTEMPDMDIRDLFAEYLKLLQGNPSGNGGRATPDNVDFSKLFGDMYDTKAQAQKDLFTGALYKTLAASSDFFSRATRIAMGEPGMIDDQRDIAIQNYDNQMAALDNQVLYLKNQLADRFNKTVDTNIMMMAAKNIRVTGGNVLELTKKDAMEISEDMRMAESNARLKQIALVAGKKSAKEMAKTSKKLMWSGLIGSAAKLGLAVETGGFTNESWGNLYAGYKSATKLQEANEAQEFNKLY